MEKGKLKRSGKDEDKKRKGKKDGAKMSKPPDDTDTSSVKNERGQRYTIIKNYYYYNFDNCQGLVVGNNNTATVQLTSSEEYGKDDVKKEVDQYFENPKAAVKEEITQEIVLVAMVKFLLLHKGRMILQKLETAFEKMYGKDFKNFAKQEKLLRFLQSNPQHFLILRDGPKWLVEIYTNETSSDQHEDHPKQYSKYQGNINDMNSAEDMISAASDAVSGISLSVDANKDCQNMDSDSTVLMHKDTIFTQTMNAVLSKETNKRASSYASHSNHGMPIDHSCKKDYRDPGEFLSDMNNFRKGHYVLVTCKNTQDFYLESLALIPWFAVYDFDEKSREDGLLSMVEEKIKSLRALYICNWSEKPKLAGYSTMWCLMRGSTQEANSRTPNDPKQWLRLVRRGVESHLDDLVGHTESCSVLKIVVLWPDNSEFVEYLHKFIMKLEEIIDPQPTLILVDPGRNKSPEEISIIKFMEPQYTLYSELKDLCVSIRKKMGKVKEKQKKLLYQLKTSSGDNDPKIDEAFASMLRENLEVLYLNTNPYGKSSFDIDEISEEEDRFFRGANLRWLAYYECGAGHFDAERDIMSQIVETIQTDFVTEFRSGVVTLFHAPGAGGTTLSQRVLWELSRETPCAKLILTFRSNLYDIARQIEALYEKTHMPIVLLIDGVEEQKMKFLMTCIQRAIVVVLHVRQHPYKMDTRHLNKNMFWLPGEVSEAEAKRIGVKFIKKCDTREKKQMLEILILEVSNNIPHYMYEFGLTIYRHEYKGLQSYVRGYLMLDNGELKPWQKILGFLSLVYFYGQAPMPCQLFATMLNKPPNYDMELDDFPYLVKEFVVPCDDEGRRNDIRIGYHAVAKEILEQVLTRHRPKDRLDNQRELCEEARRHLQNFSLKFIDFLKTKKSRCNRTSGIVIDIITKVFIVRDYKEVSASDIQTKRKMKLSRLLDDIHSPPPCIEIWQLFEKLVEAFPENPNFHAHLGRIYGIYQPENEQKAEKCYRKALEVCNESESNRGNNDDIEDSMKHTLMHVYHMYGMFYVRKISKFTGRTPGEKPQVQTAKSEFERTAGEILPWADMACDLFSKGRDKTPLGSEQSYGYVGEITARLHICDFVLRNGPFKSLAELMRKSADEKISNFVKESCRYVIELIMECFGVVDAEDLGGEFYRVIDWYNKLFQSQHPQLGHIDKSEDTCTRRLTASLIKLKYGVSHNSHTIDSITSTDDLEHLVQLYEDNIRDSEIWGVENSRRALDLDYRDWISAIRNENFKRTYSLEEVLKRVRQWHSLLNSPASTYYLFMLLSVLGFGSDYNSGNSVLLLEARELKDRLKNISKYLSGVRIPKEWLGVGEGIRCLIPNQKISRPDDTDKSKPNPNTPKLALLKGTISRPNDKVQSGFITLDLGHNPVQIDVFFVPIRTKEKLVGQAYAGERVEFCMGFTRHEGYGAYNVSLLKRIQCSKCQRRNEITSDQDKVRCKCEQILYRQK